MRAVTTTADGIRTVDVDAPDGEGVHLTVTSAGICGTDVQFAAAGISGYVYGHEFAGVDDSGTPWFVEPMLYGGACDQCRSGHQPRCTEDGHGTLGFFLDGGLAEEIVVPEYTLLALPQGLDVRDAALVEPGAVAWHAVRRSGARAGERVLVIGGGTIGLLAAAAARAQGVEAEIAVRYDHQAAAADQLGITRASGADDGEYDVVIDSAGTAASVAYAAEAARKGGCVVPLGVYPDTMPLPATLSMTKELTFVTSFAYGRGDDGVREVEQVATMLAGRPEIAATLITHRFPIEDAPEAFRVAADRAAGAIKVVVEPGG